MDTITSLNQSINNVSLIIDSSRQVTKEILEKFKRNRNIEGSAYYILIILYGILIIFGTIGNCLVVIAVVRKSNMRTVRNLFIVNLAVSDLLLCIVTMPLTLIEILTKYWPLGDYGHLCKMIGTLQAISIFVSTISITSIALDRYQVIVYPTRENLQYMGAFVVIVFIWSFALFLASPMIIFKKLVNHSINLHMHGIDSVSYCIEDWPIDHGRAIYSAFTLFVQYLLPIVIVSIVYLQINNKLNNRIPTTINVTRRNKRRSHRMRRTNCLLTSIAVIFAISWLPLNIFNLYSDVYLEKEALTQDLLVMYAVCHMMGMSSACSNPVLYGWLNENFKKEFREILHLDGACNRGNNERNVVNAKYSCNYTNPNKCGSKNTNAFDTGFTDNAMSVDLSGITK
ncbi:Neuropeptide F receptor [Pseudolycoriella hygida]|uniref:Neuropeptide F receptor n=1 Tax=Pseudolycoriella hygida TaxID=35572 RepID=A0A9Q0RZ87_9DIPT|nr:Neuropeptide F receptor [Pseudolycoriella hygida]